MIVIDVTGETTTRDIRKRRSATQSAARRWWNTDAIDLDDDDYDDLDYDDHFEDDIDHDDHYGSMAMMTMPHSHSLLSWILPWNAGCQRIFN